MDKGRLRYERDKNIYNTEISLNLGNIDSYSSRLHMFVFKILVYTDYNSIRELELKK